MINSLWKVIAMGALKNLLCVDWINSMRIIVQDAGLAQLDNRWNAKGICAPFSRVYFIRSGTGYVLIKGRRVDLLPNHAYLIPSWTVFDYSCDASMEQLYFHIFLKQPNGLDLFTQATGHGVSKMSPRDMNEVVAAFQVPDEEHAFIVQNHLYRQVLKMTSEIIAAKPNVGHYSPLVLRLFHYVQHNLSFRLTINVLAEAMNVSASMLTKRFRKEAGLPLGKYVDQLLVQDIQRRLLFGDETVAQIASELGFCDQFYLSHYFKTHTRLSPTVYRVRFKGVG